MSLAAPLAAQDTRTVTEPKLPPACTVLTARWSAPEGRLSSAAEQQPDTARIQQALDRCPAGHAVVLWRAGDKDVFLSGPLQLRPGVTLQVDRGTALFGSRNPRDYDLSPGSCGVVNRRGHGCKPLILADNAPGSGLMGDGVVDGRGGATLTGQTDTWWDLAHRAKVMDLNQSCPRILVVHRSDNFTLYRITLRNSPNFHVATDHSDGFTAWGVKIDTPKTARNTDGIDPGSSKNITIAYSYIHTGDDNVAIKAGFGGGASNISILHDHFYTGHGMSIGSETVGGVQHLLVRDLTIDGADNGIRIKSDPSRGGLVEHAAYEDVCIRDTRNPIVMTPVYTRHAGTRLPVYRDVRLHNVHVMTPGKIVLDGLDPAHRLGVTLDNVAVDGLQPQDVQAQFADITVGPGRGNLIPQGNGVAVTEAPGTKPVTAYDCAGRFVPFPATAAGPKSEETVPSVDHALYVSSDGTGEYTSVEQAVEAAPATGGATIYVAPGTYRETVTVTKPGMRVIGTGTTPEQTVVVNDKSAGSAGDTRRSATWNVFADNFRAENLTIENDYNRTHAQVSQGSQAVALYVTGDRAAFRRVRVLGNQDTLFLSSRNCHAADPSTCRRSRQYFSDCTIAGNVDFIFGDGKAVLEHCEIRSTPHSEGFVTAQSKHFPAQDSGFVLNHCRLTADDGVKNVYLGRPWRPYATVVYLDTEMDGAIVPAGWREWHPGETHSLATAYFAEYHSTGPGANPAAREPYSKQLTAAEAAQFSTKTFLSGSDGWDPEAEFAAEGTGRK